MSDPISQRPVFIPPPPAKSQAEKADAKKAAEKAKAKGAAQKQGQKGGAKMEPEVGGGDSFSRGVGGTSSVGSQKAPGPRAMIRFKPKANPEVQGEVRCAGQVAIEYDPTRAKLSSTTSPTWGVTAIVRFLPAGKPMERPVVQFEMMMGRPSGRARPSIVTLEIPTDATGVEVHFKNWLNGKTGMQEHIEDDSGQPFRWAVKPRLP